MVWVDDSKATNVGATVAALRGYPDRSVHLILGGQAKGQDFSVLLAEVARVAARVYVIGIDGPAIAAELSGAAPLEECGTLERGGAAGLAARRDRASGCCWLRRAPRSTSSRATPRAGIGLASWPRREALPCR